MQPIFLISLPRSGSTLFQRMIIKHHQIASTSEPWIMLPLVYMNKEYGSVSEYGHWLSFCAIQDFVDLMPSKKDDLHKEISSFALKLYSLHSTNGEKYFLDKTPRYFLIIKELYEIFPNAKFIFLVRNPLQILASLISSFTAGTLRKMHFYNLDLYKGIHAIAEGIENIEMDSLIIKYEDIVSTPQKVINQTYDFLNIERIDNATIGKPLEGRLGDKSDAQKLNVLDVSSISKWESILNEWSRKQFAKRFLKKIPPEALDAYGFPKQELLNSLDKLPTKYSLNSASDQLYLLESKLVMKFNLNLLRPKIRSWADDVILS